MEAAAAVNTIPRAERERRFHFWMAAVFLLIAFGGFTPTYWTKVAAGTLHAPPIVHIHGFLLFSWVLFYFIQTALVAAGRTPTHRAWGLAGISLFSVLVCSILVTKITTMRLDAAHGFGEASLHFSAVALGTLPIMIGFFIAAIANVRRPEVHKRLMYVLMAGFMTPAIARVFITLLAPPGVASGAPPPAFVVVPPGIVASLLIGIAMIHDWRTRGRPHKIYVYGWILMVLNFLLIPPLSNTGAWMRFASYFQSLGG